MVSASGAGNGEAVHLVEDPGLDSSDFDPFGLDRSGLAGYRRRFTERLLARIGGLPEYGLPEYGVAGRRWTIIHCQHWLGIPAAIALARRFSIPLVLTLHFVAPQRSPLPEGRLWDHAARWQRIGCRAAAAVIAVSRSIMHEAAERFPESRARLLLVPNGVDPARLVAATPADALRRRFVLPGAAPGAAEAKLVVFSARPVYQKGLDLLMTSIPRVSAAIDDAMWVICGGPVETLPAMDPGSRSRVRLLGHLARADAMGLAGMAGIVAAPSRYEPFGLGVLEAMLLGRAVVASGLGGHIEMIEDGVSGVLLSARPIAHSWGEVSPAALAEAQIRLLHNPQTAQRLGEAARARASVGFPFDGFIQGTLRAYERARQVARGQAPGAA